jgi:hypothetical protein
VREPDRSNFAEPGKRLRHSFITLNGVPHRPVPALEAPRYKALRH